jgi:acetolactate synthase-1/3 small subunit
MELATHTITAFVIDKPGVLNRVTSMFRRRGFNIVSLAVGHSEVPGLSRMTFVAEGDDYTVDQITKQLRKLIDVIEVTVIANENYVSRELALIKVKADTHNRGEIMQIVEIFRSNIIDVSDESVVIEVTGNGDKIESLSKLLEPFGIVELMRSGMIAMNRGGISSSEEIMAFKDNGLTKEVGIRQGKFSETGSV